VAATARGVVMSRQVRRRRAPPLRPAGHAGTLSRPVPVSRTEYDVLIGKADRQEPLVVVRLSLASRQLGDNLGGAGS
jgi:hypothetical protein